MKRLHLFEFLDLPNFPVILRDYMTDYLEFITDLFDLFQPTSKLLKDFLAQTNQSQIVDMGAGGGGPWKKLLPRIREAVPSIEVLLTDFYPNEKGFEKAKQEVGDGLNYSMDPVNALDVDRKYEGVRTMFLAYHHFKPIDAKAILQNAIDCGKPIGIFEAQERSIQNLIQFMFVPLFVLILTPFIRPFRLGRIVFTYLIPLVPFFILFDGIVSVLRTYKEEELLEMAHSCKNSEKFTWVAGVDRSGKAPNIYLLGLPN